MFQLYPAHEDFHYHQLRAPKTAGIQWGTLHSLQYIIMYQINIIYESIVIVVVVDL